MAYFWRPGHPRELWRSSTRRVGPTRATSSDLATSVDRPEARKWCVIINRGAGIDHVEYIDPRDLFPRAFSQTLSDIRVYENMRICLPRSYRALFPPFPRFP